jgi:hypothetical protein
MERERREDTFGGIMWTCGRRGGLQQGLSGEGLILHLPGQVLRVSERFRRTNQETGYSKLFTYGTQMRDISMIDQQLGTTAWIFSESFC